MKSPTHGDLVKGAWLVAAVVIFLSGANAHAADGAIGNWDIVVDFQGNTQESKLTITESDGALAGSIEGQRGKRDLDEVSFEDGALKFILNVDAQGQQFSLRFEGKIDGDKLAGAYISDFGDFDVTGSRASAAAASPIGKWKLMVDSQLGENERELVINKDLTGSYGGGDFAAFPISNVKIEGLTITMDVTLDVQGQELPSKITLTLDGDNISGALTFEGGEASIKGARAMASNAWGTWEVTATSEGLGETKRTFVFNDDGTGTYGGDIGSFDITNLKVDGDAVTFDVTLVVQDNELPSKFTGKIVDGKLTGSLNYGQGEASIEGVKAE